MERSRDWPLISYLSNKVSSYVWNIRREGERERARGEERERDLVTKRHVLFFICRHGNRDLTAKENQCRHEEWRGKR